MCSDPPKRDCNPRCNHRPFTLLTIHPLFTETTDRLTYQQMWLFFYTLAWWNYLKNLICQPVPLHTLPSIWLVSWCQHISSLLSDWSVWMGPYIPPLLSDWSVWMSTCFYMNEPITMVKFNDKSTKLQTDRQTDTLTSTVLSPPFSAGKKHIIL